MYGHRGPVTSAGNQLSSKSSSSSTECSGSSKMDKEKENSNQSLNNDKHENVASSNGSSNNKTNTLNNPDHNYTSVDSNTDETSRGRKRRKSNEGNVSSTSLSAGPSRSSSTSSVSSHQSTHSSKKHHHHRHHHHHHHNKGNGNNSKDKNPKKSYCSSSSESEEDASQNVQDVNKEATSNHSNSISTNASAPDASSLKVPPLRIVIPASSSSTSTNVSVTTPNSNGITSTSTTVTSATSTCNTTKFPYVVSSSDEGLQCENDNNSSSGFPQRITRSSQRVAQQQSQKQGLSNADAHQSDSEEANQGSDSQHSKNKKKRSKEGDNDNDSSSSSSSVGAVIKEVSPFAMPSSNCYKLFLEIRKQVDKKRQEMCFVQPKAPQGFKDYLLNRCSYILEGKNDSKSDSKPVMASPPSSLASGSVMYNLFNEQEKQRHRLNLQQLIEREKLVLSVEQEILRVHGRAARAMANQNLPFSACTILKDEEIYNSYDNESELSETNKHDSTQHGKFDKSLVGSSSGRTRYNGRIFLSWLQDVYEKWDKIKGAMLLRHRKESESLLAMQKLEWEWKLKESGLCDVKCSPIVGELFVPRVNVIEDFSLLPN